MDEIIKEIKNTREIKIPVKFINGIKVDVILKFNLGFFEVLVLNTLLKKCTCTWNFHIMYFKQIKTEFHYEDEEMFEEQEEENRDLMISQLKKCFDDTKTLLKSLKFDEKSKFPHFIDEKTIIMHSFFSDFVNMPENEEPCSVCYENTYQKTRCDHPLCLNCRFTILKSNNPRCPICRDEYLFYVKKCSQCDLNVF